MFRLLSLLITSLTLVTAHSRSPVDLTPTHVRVNALIGKHNASAFQCWEVDPPFSISAQPGTVGAKIQNLGDLKGANVVFFNQTASTNAGLHPAPAPQWVLVLSGKGVVTLPTTGQQLRLPQGDIIIANDTAEVSAIGHNTVWAAGSVAAQLPFASGSIPHTIE
ncbi:hypothetical protein Clacol_010241 [Clathrus columnatus]|uniref:Cupin type-1 domain-containing protein n=1 Tax=Clathrus columnatus TaxID=1419009 RepID=A0AAV5AMQ4_9AGAM|nr:hypothetical protein Clacol_010241 [Clathrus columnatus]